MSGEIRCDECGRLVDFDEKTDEPVTHACVDSEAVDDSLQELDFDSGYVYE